jgi:hypothetical protein
MRVDPASPPACVTLETRVADPIRAGDPPREERLAEAIRRVVRRVVAEHLHLSDAEVLALAHARLLADPASRAEVCAAFLARVEDTDR